MMNLAEFETSARGGLAAGLPGGAAHRLLAPRPRRGWEQGRVPDDCRQGAALLLVYPRDGAACVVLTVRHEGLALHAGQVSFPGGAVEPGETFAQAALREAHEEIGIDPARVRVLGQLSPLHIPASRFVLHPVLAIIKERPDLQPRPGEVDRVLETPLDELSDPRSLGVVKRVQDGVDCEVPFLLVEGKRVWGATAMILAELLALIGRPPAAPFKNNAD